MSIEPIHSTLPTDDAEIRELVAEFTATISDRIEAMQQALALLDFDSVAAMAHALKGAGGTAGYDCLTAVSQRIEKCAKDKDLEAVAPFLDELRSLNDRILV
jgi:HPt (histidine-containing phosphotransfer) domain-containing protein